MNDLNAFLESDCGAFTDSGLNARGKPIPDDLATLNLVCGETILFKKLTRDTLSRLFFFMPASNGTYIVQLSRVIRFEPYIFLLDSGYIPDPGYIVSRELYLPLPIAPPGGITGFVGSNNDKPGRFDITLICPPRTARMTWSASAPDHCLWLDTGTTEIDGVTEFTWDPAFNAYSLYWADDLVKVGGSSAEAKGSLSEFNATWQTGTWNLFFEIYATHDFPGDSRTLIIRFEGTSSDLFGDYTLSFVSARFSTGSPPPSLDEVVGGSALATIEAIDPFP